MPNSFERCSTNMSNSSKEPLSRISSMRSRAVSFPRLCCASMRALPPPRRASSRRFSSLSRMSFIPRSPPARQFHPSEAYHERPISSLERHGWHLAPPPKTAYKPGMSDHQTAAELIQQGLVHHRAGQISLAMDRYTQVLRNDPQNADALYYIATIACHEGQFQQGVDLA